MISSWLRLRSKPTVRAPRAARRHRSVKLLLERFESRTVPTFMATNYAAGTGPAAVVSADFQGTGGADFAVANERSNNVSVFLNRNDGSGTFQPAVNYPVGTPPADIVAGDLNGDGLPDLVVTNSNASTVTILFNNPQNPGTFGAPVTVQLGASSPRDVRLADMTGDGDLDIITANAGNNTVSVLLNHGDGTFAPAQTYPTGGSGAYALAVADFFGDGFPSVAVGHNGSNNVTILRDNGDGTLEPPIIEVAPGNVTGLAAGDLGNGVQDLVAANGGTGTVSVLLNDGTGNFTRSDYMLAGTPRNAFRVVLADVNGDGNLDVVTDNNASAGNPGFIYILYGNGDGTFQAPVIVNSGGNQPSGVAAADVEGDRGSDGLSDIIVPNNGSNNVTVLTNTLAPVVVSTTLTGTPIPPVDHGQIVFSDPIDPSTFTPDQFVLLDPGGNPVNVNSIDAQDSSNTRFNITFDPQSVYGTYLLTVGPGIMDRTDTYVVPMFHSQFRLSSFSEVRIPTSNSQSLDITAGPDGNLWFTESGPGRIGQITTGGAITEFALPNSSSRPVGITSGPDGNLWFAEDSANKIGRITANGTLMEFTIPTASSRPLGITAGPDGNLWFAEYQGNKIGRITTDGAITEFPVPTSNSEPTFITLGPDGNLWFTEINSANIGRITPGGTITEFHIPTNGSEPEGIAPGADGNVWFTEHSAAKIGRITPDGSVTEFSLPNGSGLSEVIAAGGDGNLWFTDPRSNQIGQITPDGTVTEFQIPTPSSYPDGITAGPDGSIWFTEYDANQIGRFIGGGPHPAPGPMPRGARTGAVVIPADLLRANPAALNPSPGLASLPREPLPMAPRIRGQASPLGNLLSSSPIPTSEAAASPALGSRATKPAMEEELDIRLPQDLRRGAPDAPK